MINPFLVQKKIRIEQTKKMIESMDGEKVSKICSALELQFGIKRKTALEYVTCLENLEFLEIKGGFIFVKSLSHTQSHSLDENKSS